MDLIVDVVTFSDSIQMKSNQPLSQNMERGDDPVMEGGRWLTSMASADTWLCPEHCEEVYQSKFST